MDQLDVTVAAQAGGYTAIAGEDNVTEIEVNYPTAYAAQTRYVYMKNAKGEYATKQFDGGASVTFNLPASMTFAGNTVLVFYAGDNNGKTVWSPVIVPIAATGVDYQKVAMASPDTLREVVAAAQEAINIANAATGVAQGFYDDAVKDVTAIKNAAEAAAERAEQSAQGVEETVAEYQAQTSAEVKEYFDETTARIDALSEDVGEKQGTTVRKNGVAIGDYETKDVVNSGDAILFDGGGV